MSDEFDEFFGAGCDKAKPSPVQILNDTRPKPLLQPPPFHLNKKERPIHRVMGEMACDGYNNKEIATLLGRSPVNVANALRQPHSQQYLAEVARAKVTEDQRVVQIIKDSVVMAVETLADIVKDGACKPSDRIAAAESLLNRRYGKPNTPINRGTDVDLSTLSDDELAQMLPETMETGTSTGP